MKPTIHPGKAAHVWLIPVRYPSSRLDGDLSWLDSQEQDRASSIYCHDHRELYLESRLWLRRILGAASGVAPRALRLDHAGTGETGSLRMAGGKASIVCDVSYTFSCIAVALRDGGEIGVDVERVWNVSSAADAVHAALNWNENKYLRTVSPDERPRAAFRLRVARQAYARARGAEPASLLERTQVALVNGHHCIVDDSGAELSFCSMTLKPGADGKEYALSVASTVNDRPLLLYRVPEQMQNADTLDTLPAQPIAPPTPAGELKEVRYKKSA